MMPTPQLFSLVFAAAEGKTELTAFDRALLKAGVGNVNLIRVSSILPPGAEYVEKLEIPPGSLLPIAYAGLCSSEPGTLIAAAVAVGIGPQNNEYGVIMEYSGHCSRLEAEDQVKQMVIEAFQYRDKELVEIKTVSVEHRVEQCGCVFAGIPLWYK
jgi:arginine decarboxylase